MNHILRITIVVAVLVTGVLAMTSVASAAFLCPVVGDGVINADAHNGDNGVDAGAPPAGTSLLPGEPWAPPGDPDAGNQAGIHANDHAYNTLPPSDPDAGPGGNPDFSPIWP